MARAFVTTFYTQVLDGPCIRDNTLNASSNPIYLHRCPPHTCRRAFGNRWTGGFSLRLSPCLTLSVFTPASLRWDFNAHSLCVPLYTNLHRSFGFIIYMYWSSEVAKFLQILPTPVPEVEAHAHVRDARILKLSALDNEAKALIKADGVRLCAQLRCVKA